MNEHAVLGEFDGPPPLVQGMRGTLCRGPWNLGQAWHVFQSLGTLGSNIRTQLNNALNSDAQKEAHLEAAERAAHEAHLEAAAAATRAADAARNRAGRAERSPEQQGANAARVAGDRAAWSPAQLAADAEGLGKAMQTCYGILPKQ